MVRRIHTRVMLAHALATDDAYAHSRGTAAKARHHTRERLSPKCIAHRHQPQQHVPRHGEEKPDAAEAGAYPEAHVLHHARSSSLTTRAIDRISSVVAEG